MSHPASLLKFQIGPVQDFIAAARSTRDLWSGSYLLSHLMAAGIMALPRKGEELIFPNPKGQPLLGAPSDTKKLLTPNIPNLFVAEIDTDSPDEVAREINKTIRNEWVGIAESCFAKLADAGVLKESQKDAFIAQAKAFLTISWQVTPLGDEYAKSYGQNGLFLDAVRQTRDFPANPIPCPGEKDSLSGNDHAFVRGKDAYDSCRFPEYKQLFKHENDHLSAITLIKRVWHLAHLNISSTAFPIRSTRAIAARKDDNDDETNTDQLPGEKYLAAIAFDGDSIGRWISGEMLKRDSDLREHHRAFSRCLSDFALNEVRDIVEKKDEQTGIPLGFLIYAGGDDVVALVPADAALGAARKIREAFRSTTDSIKDKDGQSPDGSAGIAIAHFKSPLQDLIREARQAEKDAKRDRSNGGQGRSAFSITLLKRSGEISKWGAKWESGAIELHDEIFKAMTGGSLSARFPHRVCQLLEPYRTTRSGLSRQQDVVDFPVHEVIAAEFLHAATRQGSRETADHLKPLLESYLTGLGSDPQTCLSAVIGLCTTLAFTLRNLPSADRQPATA